MKKVLIALAALALFSLTFAQTGRYIRTDVANTYTSGAKQSFQHSATTAGFKLLSFPGDPTSLENGDMWYNSTLNKFRKYEAGAISDIGSGGGGGGDSGSVGGTGVSDFNLGTLPAAAANGLNVVWQLDATTDPDNVSAYILMTSITKVGTLTAGVWNGTAIDEGYVDTNVVLDNAGNTYTAGTRQLFAHSASAASLNLVPTAGDPSGPANGDIWYNNTTGKFRKYENGATSDLTTTGSAPGADTNVVYNDAGVLGAESDLAWNETTNILTSTGGFQSGGSAAGQVQITEATADGSNKATFTVGNLSADYTLTFPSIGSGGVLQTTSGGTVSYGDVALTTSTSGNYLASCTNGLGITGCPAAAEGATAPVAFKLTDTLAANPALNAEEMVFTSDGTGGGIMWEGVTADSVEGILVWSPTTSDRTLTLPDASDTLVGLATTDTLTNKTLDGGDSAAGTARVSGGDILQIISHNTDCTSLTGFSRGEMCYEEDANTIYVCEPTAGNCDTAGEWILASGSGTGDITSVFSCLTGGCTTITIGTGEYLDGGTATVDATGEGILAPRGTSCAAATDEGHLCWDTDDDDLYVGNGATPTQINVAASVKTRMYFRPNQNEPPSTNYATLDLRNVHPVLDFDPTTDECAVFTGVLTNYAGGGFNVNLVFACGTEVDAAEDVYWETSFEYIDDGTLDTDADSFAATSSCTATCSTTSGIAVTATCAHTDGAQIDSLADGNPFRIKVCRDANNASDDADDDSELLTVLVTEP